MKILVLGATSCIGSALTRTLDFGANSFILTGRDQLKLFTLTESINCSFKTHILDLSDTCNSVCTLKHILQNESYIDLIIYCCGAGSDDATFPLDEELNTIQVNVTSFTIVANLAYSLFKSQGSGHLVSISSVAAIKGGIFASYNASKAYMSSYLEGLICRSRKEQLDICITDVRPGYIDTPMAKGDAKFWVCKPDKAARQIVDAIMRKKLVVYVSRRWQLFAILLRFVPLSLYLKLQ